VINADGNNLRQLQILHTAQSIKWVDNSHLMLSALSGFDDPGLLLSYTGITPEENTIDYLNANQLTNSFDAAVYNVSPNGQFLAYTNYELPELDQDGTSIEANFTLNPEIIVLDILSHQTISILPTDTNSFNITQTIHWLNDSSFVFLNQCDIGIQSLWLMSVTGEGRELLPCREGQINDFSASPNGQQLSFVSQWEGTRHIYVLTIADSNLMNLNVP
jgi:Tol biopolymer transport system component